MSAGQALADALQEIGDKRERIATLTRELEEARAQGDSWRRVAERLESEKQSAEAQLAERTRERDKARDLVTHGPFKSVDELLAHLDEPSAEELIARAESAEQQVRALREALRLEVLHERQMYVGREARKPFMFCALCEKDWALGSTEQHAPGCLAALAQQEGGVKP